jgi:hypothetical protein
MGPEFSLIDPAPTGNGSGSGIAGNVGPEFQFRMRGIQGDATESGLIEVEHTAGNYNAKSILFQLGDKQYLIEPNWAGRSIVSYDSIKNNPYDKNVNIMDCFSECTRYDNVGKKGYLPNAKEAIGTTPAVLKCLSDDTRFNSIKDAREALIPDLVKENPNKSFQCMNYWFVECPDYVPTDISPEMKSFLENPPMPWHYNLTTMMVKPIGLGNSVYEKANKGELLSKIVTEPCQSSIDAYMTAKNTYEETLKVLAASYINQEEAKEFGGFYILPASSANGVQPALEGLDTDDVVNRTDSPSYYVKGGLHLIPPGNNQYFSIGYNPEAVFDLPKVKQLDAWHKMIKEF